MLKKARLLERAAITTSFVIIVFFSIGLKAYPLEKADLNELYKNALKEGKVSFYASMQVTVAQELADRFQKRYPGIKAEVYRATSEKLLAKVMTEGKSPRINFDVVQMSVEKTGALKEAKIITKYELSSRSLYPKGFIDPEGYWTSPYHNPCTVAYNTRMVKASEVPKTWEQLLDPKWKGKMGMDSSKYVWSIVLRDIMGEEQRTKYLKELAKQKIIFRPGVSSLSMLMTAGEFPIMVWAFAPTIERLKLQGAPVDWARMDSSLPSDATTCMIAAKSPHPNAARLFYEFVFSKEGQEEVLAPNDKVVPRTDVNAHFAKAFRPFDVRPNKPLTAAEYKGEAELFRSIFGL